MKVVYPVCCGVDVRKSFLVATVIATTSGLEPSYSRKRFSTFNRDLKNVANWLKANNCFDVCNIGLDSVVSDMFGKSASLITDYLLSDESFNPDHCVSLLQRGLKKKADSVIDRFGIVFDIILQLYYIPTYTYESTHKPDICYIFQKSLFHFF